MLLKDKAAIIYGAAGGIGSGVARTFAREGARVYLVGRTQAKLDVLTGEIAAAGGWAEAAVVDATDEQAVNAHVQAVAGKAGRVDISINLLSHGDLDNAGYVQGLPLTEIPAASFMRPFSKGLLSNYITAQAAARQMTSQGTGVILTLTNAGSMGGTPLMGSTGVVAAAIELFARTLAAEVGPAGVRVLGVRIAAVLETIRGHTQLHTDVFEKESGGLDRAGIEAALANMSLLRRMTTRDNIVDALAFLASDRAAGMTATFLNVTAGLVPG
jgi:NAD(P)-dependent dehydrogenase (short-subunit alcohol dehydrogenase family)